MLSAQEKILANQAGGKYRSNISADTGNAVEDYYKFLGISPTATTAEIKRAFRKKAKELHPDIPHNADRNGGTRANEQAMRTLLRAYEILLNARRRAEFDFFYTQTKRKVPSFNYRDWLKEQPDMQSKATLIFFDLFHHEETEAVELFLQLRTLHQGFSLRPYFNRGDFMDGCFVLAEELYFRDHYYEAFLLLEQIIREELKKDYFRHFFPEVLIFVRKLLREKIFYTLEDDVVLECCEASLDFGLNKTDQAEILKKMAEIYYRMGDLSTAAGCVEASLRMNPRIRGIAKLKKNYQEQLWR